ncbi:MULTISPECIES: DUF4397 domain-containing protein [unclassified Frigoribacterium]|uniref:DUF4397 domain-containing protein n=1 Tax=unclassified Frigoribacterium TaxID=2627005 RepID=UPI00177FC316|nr:MULTISPECIES: DUF4397 domain-containing protein [unclassified Frigoribacterium]MBD8703140.1 DUF4397 domain-containing protein [Frigoribacterium sp. CFBP 13712]MDY0890578.1 DUF4397 domain-containing protein [Frigoribacterium sp. CFBP9030]
MAPAISTIRTPASSRRRLTAALALGVAATAAVAASVVGVSPAQAAEGDGWVRVGHLSPDTKSVDVTLTSIKGGQVVMDLDDVTYGQVSPYEALPAGTYVVSMTAADAPAAEPVISTNVTVESGQPITALAYGENDDLRTEVFTDDLTAPAPGEAKLRLVQAANVTDTVDVATSTGTTIASDAPFGSASGYASVDAGPWTLDLTGDDVEGSADVDLAAGSVNTLFVLDNSTGGLTVVPVVDSASTAETPQGGVQTGGGYLAEHPADEASSETRGFWASVLGFLRIG